MIINTDTYTLKSKTATNKNKTWDRYEIITGWYEEKKEFNTLSLIPESNDNQPAMYKRTIPSKIPNCKIGTILRFHCSTDQRTPEPTIVPNSDFLLLENGTIQIGSKIYQKPICDEYEIVVSWYEEKKVFYALALIPQFKKYNKPIIHQRAIPSNLPNCKVGTILRYHYSTDQPNPQLTIVNSSQFQQLENGNLKIGQIIFNKPICGSGLIIYNEKGEIFLEKNGSHGIQGFMYHVGALAKKRTEIIRPVDINSIREMIRVLSVEDKLSIRNMVNDITEVESVFKCFLKKIQNRLTTAEEVQRVIQTIIGDINDDLNSVVEDPQDCGFHNYLFIKGGIDNWKLSKLFNNLNELYLQNALFAFEGEIQNKRHDIDYSNALNHYIDFRFFNAETRNDFETIPLFQRFFFVKCKVKTLNCRDRTAKIRPHEYTNETARFYPRNPVSNTWLELPKFMRAKIVKEIDELTSNSNEY